ncbi:hypothetical protein ABWH97_13890 [Nitratireductor sp. ac15]
MGNSSKPAPQKKEEAPKPVMNTVDPFMPGMDQLLANQLAAGFGGTPQSYLTAFNQTYVPMQVPQSFAPPSGGEEKKSGSSNFLNDLVQIIPLK